MIKSIILLFSVFISASSIAQHTIRFSITSLPSYHLVGSDIYLAGSFNGWNPKDEKYKFRLNSNGVYTIELKMNTGKAEFKLTRGGWEKVECLQDGTPMKNREIDVEGNELTAVSVLGWADHFPSKPRKSTASKNVIIIDTAFFIPQLNRTRRVWIYLPTGYNNSKQKYPVLYMHDGQNVFDDAGSYAGEWGVDECLDTLGNIAGKCIVVAVDHGNNKRINEYCPYVLSLSGFAAGSVSNKGEGNQYVDFLVKTLKPFIDKNFRTQKKKKTTMVAGSSMGGLISMYAVLKYPKVFGGAGVFSPAFWVGPQIFEDIRTRGHKIKSKIFFYAGNKETDTMVPYTLKAFDALHRVSKSKIEMIIRAEGLHNEQRWREEFPLFYKWIMKR